MAALNADWLDLDAAEAPDGDADLEGADFSSFVIPPCRRCGGMLKPDVVFFGENVPRDRVDAAFGHLDKADAMLIVGSSLMVYSGFRFVERAVSLGKPVAAINLGRTRADALLALKVEAPCESALSFLLGSRATSGSIQPARLKLCSSSALVGSAELERSPSSTARTIKESYSCASPPCASLGRRFPSSALSAPSPLSRVNPFF